MQCEVCQERNAIRGRIETMSDQNPDATLKRDLEFLYEVGCLRHVPRTWIQFFGPRMQNLAEHTVRVTFIAMTIAAKEGIGDLGKIAKMALIHDIGESRTGDVHYLSRQFCERFEEKAIHELFGGTVLSAEMISLWKECEAKETIEAKIIKDADNLDVDFELREQMTHGNPLATHWKEMREHVYVHKLFTATAKTMWKEIQGSNPHDWHLNASNRFKAGDWKK
ncbi:MAG TPA: HD domain-containing protein [Candidatus Nanoarchaeia archaeon]|nr:HD domain-containing protein [Candidatus Nanoarchaeia archaeon]